MIKTILLVGSGGALGSILRYFTTILINKYWSNYFPFATFFTNMLGCFLIGLLVGVLEKNNLADSNLKWFLITGFCGGYTTFSAFSYENLKLFQDQNPFIALIYIASSVFIGILAVWFGLFITKL